MYWISVFIFLFKHNWLFVPLKTLLFSLCVCGKAANSISRPYTTIYTRCSCNMHTIYVFFFSSFSLFGNRCRFEAKSRTLCLSVFFCCTRANEFCSFLSFCSLNSFRGFVHNFSFFIFLFKYDWYCLRWWSHARAHPFIHSFSFFFMTSTM